MTFIYFLQNTRGKIGGWKLGPSYHHSLKCLSRKWLWDNCPGCKSAEFIIVHLITFFSHLGPLHYQFRSGWEETGGSRSSTSGWHIETGHDLGWDRECSPLPALHQCCALVLTQCCLNHAAKARLHQWVGCWTGASTAVLIGCTGHALVAHWWCSVSAGPRRGCARGVPWA